MSKQADEGIVEQSQGAKSGCSLVSYILIIILIMLVGALGFACLQWIKLQSSMTQQLAVLQHQSDDNTQQIQSLNQSVQGLNQSNTNDMRTTILNRWYTTEAQYLVRLANDYMQFMHNTPAALALLKQADQSLQNVQDGSVDPIRQQLAQYISNLSAMPSVDVTSLYMQINAINDQIDKLPLPINPLQPEKTTLPPVGDEEVSWWQKGLNRTMQALKEIVIVRYNATNTLPLVMPEEKNFLLQNLHAEMENAAWAVLHHNSVVYKTSLSRASAWIQQYFVQEAPETINALQALNALKAVNIESQPIDMAAVMQQFEALKA